MAVVTPRIAPFINVTFWVTSVWWELPRNHRGLDIATATAGGSVPIYSMCNGTVIRSEVSGSLTEKVGYGNVVIIKDDVTGMGFLYAHLSRRDVALGDHVVTGQQIGMEGETGEAYGMHLHLEMQDLTNHDWIYRAPKEVYTNPADWMGIPNVEGTECYYDGTPVPPTPPTPTTTRKHKFKWVLYAKNLRNKRIINLTN